MKTTSNLIRRRQIAWSAEADAFAIQLATERGYYPERMHGGISRMLADMVAEESTLKLAESAPDSAAAHPKNTVTYRKANRKKSRASKSD